ncbi:hypothetical protein F4782DRAFT_106472 [Xylaria castorea]|nr:hypothetical protein F4782DRAFT_106472 [Xylaria castorea]
MRTFLLPTPLLFALLLQTGSLLAIDNDFSAYPEGSQSCLYDSADEAGCTSADSGAELNQCLCKNRNNFVYNTASCVAKKSPSDLNAVYETLSSNCAGTGVTLSVSKEAFIAAAAAATQTTSPTSTSTSTPTNTDSSSSPTSTNPGQTPSDNGLSTGTKIGIGVGVGFGVIAAALAAWFIWAYQRKRRSTQSVHSHEISGGGAGSAYGAAGFGMPNQPRHEYAQDNAQQAPAELDPVAWNSHAGYGAPGYTPGKDKKDGTAGMPLLAELGNESDTRQTAVELPANPSYLGYSDRAPGQGLNGSVTPDGVSPATYRSDISPFTPSRSSEAETYR